MHSLPTDRYVLQCIFDMYKEQYPGKKDQSGRSENDPYIAIDVHAVASRLGCSAELLFGRLYYHLDKKHRYKQDDGTIVPLFYLKVGEKRHAVHFPFLASVLATENRDFRRFFVPLCFSALALLVSVASLFVSVLSKR